MVCTSCLKTIAKYRVAPRLFWETNVLHSAFVPSGRIRLLGGHNTRLDTTPELWFSCRRFSSVPPSTEVSYKQLKHLLAGGKSLVIDVREPWELREYGSIPGTINVPLGQVNTALQLGPEEFNEKYGGELPQRVDNIVFTCLAGIRSKTALDMASELGYKECMLQARNVCREIQEVTAAGRENLATS
ncbi:thiosulfate sulfurtransferase/rhodanese-like domain-containing protein 3 isoform X5 [Syngnathoides biaculeatus]|uniref:thiosulfate sulfurtransferase/rhodanese-like domain-containing protein 3 isoform X5 n=1 Tax=Syngnathoides biaculeatus TaxID=300417 RepID=UPI002ADDEE0E|nr:thiosulfate sulfurtransferase/rhodanese-like domain-containing protein 3 isoform X5 [Syngnathoides biaculeatus]